MTSDELCYLDLVEAGRRIQARQLSSLEVTQAMLDRIGRFEPRFKCYVKPTPELALTQARQADSEIARGTLRGPLHGVPIAVKDLCHTKGIATAAGMPIHKDYRPDRDATVSPACGRPVLFCWANCSSLKAPSARIILRSTRR